VFGTAPAGHADGELVCDAQQEGFDLQGILCGVKA
jgi:hypothetical protein